MNYYKIKVEKTVDYYGVEFIHRNKIYIEAKNITSAIGIVEDTLGKKECIVYVKEVNRLPRNIQYLIKSEGNKND